MNSADKPPLLNTPAAQPSPQFDASALVVEDNPVNQELAVRRLQSMGLRVAVAANGAEAVAITAERRFDLVLMDCEMPVMDGFEAARRIRERELAEGAKQITIVALTADVLTGTRQRCLDVGMNDYLEKPFEKAQIAAMVGRWLSAQRRPDVAAPPSRPAPLPATTTIDAAAIAAIRALIRPNDAPSKGDALVSRVVEKFLEIAPSHVAAIQEGLAHQDANAIRHAAHSLKSSAANVGATMVANCAKLVESSILQNNFEGAQLAADSLADALEQVLPELNSLVLAKT